MKRTAILATLASITAACLVFAAEPPRDLSQRDQQVARTVKELQEQQATIAANQTKIDEKLVTLAEAVRQARIFASRGGRP